MHIFKLHFFLLSSHSHVTNFASQWKNPLLAWSSCSSKILQVDSLQPTMLSLKCVGGFGGSGLSGWSHEPRCMLQFLKMPFFEQFQDCSQHGATDITTTELRMRDACRLSLWTVTPVHWWHFCCSGVDVVVTKLGMQEPCQPDFGHCPVVHNSNVSTATSNVTHHSFSQKDRASSWLESCCAPPKKFVNGWCATAVTVVASMHPQCCCLHVSHSSIQNLGRALAWRWGPLDFICSTGCSKPVLQML